ncbi:MAG: sugar ABC transporter permease [Lachnospiraceae bacterium]|nr:sugar ABC transporter permease [Lachnospiraceae bacterium]MCR5501109.1 sugar ABC transporter permease [Acetatifactor sp.]
MRDKVYRNITIFLFLLPALMLFVGVLIYPILMSGYYSLFDMRSIRLNGTEAFGLGNYKELLLGIGTEAKKVGFLTLNLPTFGSINFWKALGNSLLLAALSVFLQLPLALGLALMLGKGIKGERTFLSIYFMPVLISTVVIGQLWRKIYNPDYGILNAVLELLGKEDAAHTVMPQGGWLGNVKSAIWCVFIPTLWQYVGYHMLLMYAGVRSVSPELREAAKLDGATDAQVDWYVVIPCIKNILRVSVIFAVTGSLKSFDLIYVLTEGGPYHATEVPSTLMISMLFLRNRYGMGSTIAVLLILLCFAFALIISAAFKEREYYGRKKHV